MDIEVTLRVSGIDIDNPEIEQTLGERLPMVLWQGEGADLSMTFVVNDQNAPAEVLKVVRSLETAIPTFRALRVDRDLVSTTDIALRAGVSREAARKWGKEVGFPVPFATVGENKHVWLWVEVLTWLNTTRGIEIGDRQLSEAEMVQIDNCLMHNPDATSVRWESVGVPEFVTPTELAAGFRNVARRDAGCH